MWLLLATALSAVLVVLLTRGRMRQIARLRLPGAWLLAVGLVIQAILEVIHFPPGEITTIGYGALMTSYALILAFCVANLPTRGFGVIAVGVAMNALVIGLNQGMPTKPVGTDAQGNRVYKPVEQSVKHRQSSGDDLLGILGDRILFPAPLNEIVSFGDLVIAVGICELVYFATRKSPPVASTV